MNMNPLEIRIIPDIKPNMQDVLNSYTNNINNINKLKTELNDTIGILNDMRNRPQVYGLPKVDDPYIRVSEVEKLIKQILERMDTMFNV